VSPQVVSFIHIGKKKIGIPHLHAHKWFHIGENKMISHTSEQINPYFGIGIKTRFLSKTQSNFN
jgi:hypothetical protein